MTRGRAGVLVDLDGTLVDTNYLHTLAWSRAFSEMDAWAPMNAIHRLIGMGGDQLVPELLGHDLPGVHDAQARHFAALKPEVRAFPGAASLLRALHDLGLVVVLASSASEDDLADLRAVLHADDAIDAVVHSGDVSTSKPSPDIFESARDKGGIDDRRVLAIGDSVWDVRAAHNAEMACITVESGGTSRAELFEVGALAVYRDAEQLCDHLLTSPIATLVVSGHS